MSSMNYPFHLVELSPWPLAGSFAMLMVGSEVINMFLFNTFFSSSILMIMLFVMYQWWRDVDREGFLGGFHTEVVSKGLGLGMMFFILSEIMFFFSFFWNYFNCFLSLSGETGLIWPPVGLMSFDPFSVPLMNTLLLLSSGFAVTWGHHSALSNDLMGLCQGLLSGILLGLIFTLLQGLEYWEASFCISDSCYGSSFYIATGFHGIHVIVGTIFLVIMLFRSVMGRFSGEHHSGLEFSLWYWHFVDFVWLFLYLCVYWLSG